MAPRASRQIEISYNAQRPHVVPVARNATTIHVFIDRPQGRLEVEIDRDGVVTVRNWTQITVKPVAANVVRVAPER